MVVSLPRISVFRHRLVEFRSHTNKPLCLIVVGKATQHCFNSCRECFREFGFHWFSPFW